MDRRSRSAWLAIGAIVALAACASPIPPVPDDPAVLAAAGEYRIGPGDAISVKLFYEPELSEDLRVRPDGRISLQLIGEVQAAGQTPEELSRVVSERYAAHVPRADATVIVRDFVSQRAYVGGEVRSPKMVRLDGQTTLTDAVLAAGGTIETAELSSVILLRRGPNGREVYRVDLNGLLRGNDVPIPYLRPYDVVYVPKSFIAEVNTYVELYINRMIPRNASFVATYEIQQFPEVPAQDLVSPTP